MHSELLLLAQEWVASQGVERVNFYSAQEEPSGEPLLKPSPKKAAVPKRVTNAQVLEQVAALVSQVKVLAARQDQMERDGTGPAKVVSGHASSSIAVVPPVSAGLQAGQGVAPPAPVPFAKVAKLIGPPPKIRPSQTAPAESALLAQIADWRGRHCAGHLPTEHSHHCLGSSPDQRFRPSGRTAGWWRNFWIHKRSSKTRENAGRSCGRDLTILSGHDAAGSSSSFPRHDSSEGCQPAPTPLLLDVHERDWRVQGLPGNRPGDVAFGPHHRCGISRGSSSSPRKISLACHIPRTISSGSWRLADCISPEFGGGSPAIYLPGQDQHHQPLRPAIRQPCSFGVVGGGAGLCKRAGSAHVKERRGNISEESRKSQSRPRCSTISEEKDTISSESEARSRPAGPVEGHSFIIGTSGEQGPNKHSFAKPSFAAGVPEQCHHEVGGAVKAPFSESLSLSRWCANLVTLVFRSRTPFATFARSSIHLSRDAVVATSSAFPIPLPCIGVFGRMPSGLSSSQRAKLHFQLGPVPSCVSLVLLVEWRSFRR